MHLITELSRVLHSTLVGLYCGIMTGLVKAKKYDWQDSNLALFGSDLEKNVSTWRSHNLWCTLKFLFDRYPRNFAKMSTSAGVIVLL